MAESGGIFGPLAIAEFESNSRPATRNPAPQTGNEDLFICQRAARRRAPGGGGARTGPNTLSHTAHKSSKKSPSERKPWPHKRRRPKKNRRGGRQSNSGGL